MIRLDDLSLHPVGDLDADREVEVLHWSNGWKTYSFLPPPPDPLPEEEAPPPKPLSYPELLAMARDGLDVPATDALNLLHRYRQICQNLAAMSKLPLNSPNWQANMGRLFQKLFALSQKEVQ